MSSTDGKLRGEFQHRCVHSLDFSAEQARVLAGRPAL